VTATGEGVGRGPVVDRGTRGAAADLVFAAGLWGSLYVVLAGTFDQVPPITLNVLRLVVGVGALLIVFRGRIGWGRAPVRRVLAAGAVVAVTMLLQFLGTSLTGAAEASILTGTTPAFVLLLGAFVDRERVGRLAWAGCAIAVVGVAVLALRPAVIAADSAGALDGAGGDIGPRLLGDAMLVGAAATWALFSSIGRPLVAAVGAFRAILQSALVAIVLLAPLVPVELAGRPLPPVTPQSVGAVLYLGIASTALSWSLWYRGYARAPAIVSAAAFFAQPAVGATLGVLILGEVLGPAFLAGSALIVVGVLGISAAAGAAARGATLAAPAEG
jgi:drug/metabolite transporter (DMT)-like permease